MRLYQYLLLNILFARSAIFIGAFSVTGGGNESLAVIITVVFTLGVMGLLIWALSKWIRQRWNRDTFTG